MNLRDLKLRLRALVRPRRVERELDDELAFHLGCETRKLVERGMDPEEAARQARARFGPVPLAADRCRDARGTAFIDQTVRDIAYAGRTFRRAPLAALTVVGTVALGLGLVTVVFTFYNAWYLQSDGTRIEGRPPSAILTGCSPSSVRRRGPQAITCGSLSLLASTGRCAPRRTSSPTSRRRGASAPISAAR